MRYQQWWGLRFLSTSPVSTNGTCIDSNVGRFADQVKFCETVFWNLLCPTDSDLRILAPDYDKAVSMSSFLGLPKVFVLPLNDFGLNRDRVRSIGFKPFQ